MKPSSIPLPRGWSRHVASALVCASALARAVVIEVRVVPYSLAQMRDEVRVFCLWYNGVRPNSSLGGATPDEVYFGVTPARDRPRFEPRERFPRGIKPSKNAPKAVRGKRGVKLELVVDHFEGRKHLPVVELRRAA